MKGRVLMQFFYGEKNLARVLDETEFWKHQESEHTVVVRQVTPNLEAEFVSQLQQYEESFNQAQGIAVKYMESVNRSSAYISPALEQQMLQFIDFAVRQSQQFVLLLHQMLTESEAVRKNQVSVIVINHVRRESEYYIGVAQLVLYNMNPNPSPM